ncbi:MAG: DUF5103 domain-containing protein [Bacteroidales bacterium]
MRTYLLIVGFLGILGELAGQPSTEALYNAKTIQLHPVNEPLLAPVMELNSGDQLLFSFDLLGEEEQALSYRIIHCKPNGSPSAVSPFDYLDGFDSAPVDEVEQSFNTSVSYYHYRVKIPNRDMRILLSGRYRVEAFVRSHPDSVVAAATFFVFESRANSYLEEFNRGVSQLHQDYQQLEVTVAGSKWQNRPEQVTVMVVQNSDYQHARYLNQPSEIRGASLVYRSTEKLKFDGGNEFRSFNTNSLEYAGSDIREINFYEGRYHYLLYPDADRSFENYQQRPDINGRFKIDAERRSEPDVEADYVYVYFSLPGKPFVAGEQVVILGSFNRWNAGKEWVLPYNFEEKAYQRRFLLKQGYYNYTYAVVQPDGTLEKHVFSGNHAQTGNQYQAFVFYRAFGANYAQLISVSQLAVNVNELP